MSEAVLDAYAARAAELAARFEALDAGEVLAPVLDLIPEPPGRVLDAGAGSGRDAAWLAGRGLSVTAVEPTPALRAAGVAVHGRTMDWVDDRLPELACVAGVFDFVLVNGVWHHLEEGERCAALARLAALMHAGGRLVISLRQGPEADGGQVVALDAEVEIARAEGMGFTLIRQVPAFSHQADNRAAGVRWVWLGFGKETP